MTPEDQLRSLIAREGPVPFSTAVEVALYGPGGFYTTAGGPGRTRDFLTSPELGPLFGAVVAAAIDDEWFRCGRPDPWVVVDAGAGTGALARAVLDAAPACSPALRYVAVERSPALRAAIAETIALDEPSQVLAVPPPVDDEPVAQRPRGPMVTVLAELPVGPVAGLVIANELVDNIAFDIYERRSRGWCEVRVGAEPTQLVELTVPADQRVAAHLDGLAPAASDGSRVPWQGRAQSWLRDALGLLAAGRVIVLDYGRPTGDLAAGGWLRTYRRGGPGGPPLSELGSQDITTDVALDQLALVRPPDWTGSQSDWLGRHGLADLRAQAAASQGGLTTLGELKARSRLGEADALCDPAGLGGFRVAEWQTY